MLLQLCRFRFFKFFLLAYLKLGYVPVKFRVLLRRWYFFLSSISKKYYALPEIAINIIGNHQYTKRNTCMIPQYYQLDWQLHYTNVTRFGFVNFISKISKVHISNTLYKCIYYINERQTLTLHNEIHRENNINEMSLQCFCT